MQIKEIRRKSPEELQQLRSELLATLQNQTRAAAERLRTAQVNRLVLRPQQQQSNDTCLFACLISIKKAVAERLGRVYMTPESLTAQQAREAGILRDGGTFANQETQDFIRTNLNLETEVSVEAPSVKLEMIVHALEKGNVPLVSYSLGSIDHWIAISDIRSNGDQVEVIAMNPLMSQNLETMSPQLFAERLAAGEFTTAGAGSSQLMIVQLPEEALTPENQFRVIERRQPGMRVLDRRPGKNSTP